MRLWLRPLTDVVVSRYYDHVVPVEYVLEDGIMADQMFWETMQAQPAQPSALGVIRKLSKWAPLVVDFLYRRLTILALLR